MAASLGPVVMVEESVATGPSRISRTCRRPFHSMGEGGDASGRGQSHESTSTIHTFTHHVTPWFLDVDI